MAQATQTTKRSPRVDHDHEIDEVEQATTIIKEVIGMQQEDLGGQALTMKAEKTITKRVMEVKIEVGATVQGASITVIAGEAEWTTEGERSQCLTLMDH